MAFPHDGKKFKKGDKGNPHGAPKGKRMSTILREMLESGVKINGQKKDKEALAKELFTIAFSEKTPARAKLKAIEQILDRIEGKPTQTIKTEAPTTWKVTMKQP